MLLEAQGYVAVSFVLNNGSGDLFKQGPFDVIILGQSVDDAEKGTLSKPSGSVRLHQSSQFPQKLANQLTVQTSMPNLTLNNC